MRKIKLFLITIICFTVTCCAEEETKFPIDKRYWDLNDYDKAVLELNYGYKSDDKLPSFDDPETSMIVKKLTDQQNFEIILSDEELGIKYRNEIAQKFFNEWKNMTNIYDAMDRRDKYLYDEEMLAVWHFGLRLQLRYFKLGNDEIKENADDPNSSGVVNSINSNIRTLVNNYMIYLDQINNEKAFTESGKNKLAEGIDKYFHELIALYPNANYKGMKNKAKLILNKTQSEKIKISLNNFIELIDSKSLDKQPNK
ncbi:MAG: hypothetical protein ACWA5P_06650 [bacterium]